MKTRNKNDDLDHAIAKILQAEDEVVDGIEDGLVKSEILRLRGEME